MMDSGTLAGFPVLDVAINLTDGGYHPVDSSAIAFEIAAKGAFRQSIPKAAPQLLETYYESRRLQHRRERR